MVMAYNLTSLTREWIQYLKNNQFVKGTPDPKTEKLIYIKQPKVQTLIKFLDAYTDFDEESVRSAIKQVLTGNQSAPTQDRDPEQKAIGGPKALPAPQSKELADPSPQQQEPQAGAAAKKYNNDDVEDVNFRDAGDKSKSQDPLALQHKRKPRFKYRYKTNEDFYDRQGSDLTENNIKEIFKILLAPKPKAAEPAPDAEKQEDPYEVKARQQEYMRKIKQMVREVMTPQQRKALWRALQ